MDYFKQRRAYRELKMYEIDVSSGQNNLYRELLDYANDQSKLDCLFHMKNSALLSLTGLSESGIKKARNELVQRGLIEYRQGRKNSFAPSYRIIQLYEDRGTKTTNQYGKSSPEGALKKEPNNGDTPFKDTNQSQKSGKSNPEGVEVVAQKVPQPVPQIVAHKELTNTDFNKTNTERDKTVRHKYGSYKNVLLTETDFGKLKTEFPNDWQVRLNTLSEYMASSGKHYKNYLATIRNWARRDKERVATGGRKNSFPATNQNDSFSDADLPF